MKKTLIKIIATLGLMSVMSLNALANTAGTLGADANGVYFTELSGVRSSNKFVDTNNSLYYFGVDGYAITGWQKINNVWYFFDYDHKAANGWKNISNQWYYFENFQMQTGWKFINNNWYYLKPSGEMAIGWNYIDGNWYLLRLDGPMTFGWQQVNGKWYYMDGKGRMLTGTQVIDGKNYEFGNDGAWIEGSAYSQQLNGQTANNTTTLTNGMQVAQILGLTNYYYDRYINDINYSFSVLNSLRTGNGLNYDESLVKTATAMAIDATSNGFEFTGDQTGMQRINGWLSIYGEKAGCVITAYANSPVNCLVNMKNSAGDLKNIQNENYEAAGIGFCQRPKDGLYYTVVILK